METKTAATALGDIMGAVHRLHLVGMLGWQDIRQRYRRSILGPFWLTISMGVMIATIGLVFGQIFNSPMKVFLPFLAAGMILWGLIAGIIIEGCDCFIAAEGIIKQLPIPLFVHVLRMIWRNILIFAHNIIIFPLVLLAVGRPISWLAFLSVPGLLVAVANLTWVALLLGVLCTRYRDLSQIIASLLQVLYFLTPIMWMPSSLPSQAGKYLVDFNPMAHMLSIVRSPLMDQMPSQSDWLVSVGICVVGWALALFMYGRYKRRIAYWL
jgi:lipopolysaccharide transport system permease protein